MTFTYVKLAKTSRFHECEGHTKSPIGLSGREAQPFSGSLLRVSDEDARFLQQIAFETVAEFAPETIRVAVSPKERLTTMWGEIKMSK